jgi:hypothetical protein
MSVDTLAPAFLGGKRMTESGRFCLLQICYSKGSHPYLTGLAPGIPPAELSPPEKKTGKVTFDGPVRAVAAV